MDKSNTNWSKFTIIFGTIVVLVFAVGLYLGATFFSNKQERVVFINNLENSSISTSSLDMAPFWETWKMLDEKFVSTGSSSAKVLSSQDKVWGAIEGLTKTYGDPYTVFMPPEDSKTFETDIRGNFEGVGMEIGIKNDTLTVVSPLKDTPAYKAGIKSGDQIISIDGKSTDGLSVDSAVKLIRGKAGTQVVLKIYREGKTEAFEVKITRGLINVPTIETEIKGEVFVIRLYNFYAPAANEFKNALREFVESGKAKLILDLRGNPGGYLDSAVDMASWFLPLGKTIVRESFGDKIEEQVYRSKGYAVFNENLKMIILVNEGSASASEILAGALQEHGLAKLVGTNTFGKGSVQELIKITPETSLKVTIARWLTPKGISISEGGLKPDYEVKITDTDFKAGKDPQMEKALQLLEK